MGKCDLSQGQEEKPSDPIPVRKPKIEYRSPQLDKLRRQMQEEIDAAKKDADQAACEAIELRAEIDRLRAEHCREVAELKMRLETEVQGLCRYAWSPDKMSLSRCSSWPTLSLHYFSRINDIICAVKALYRPASQSLPLCSRKH